ncbi:Hypothetical_protein [Hexamita inflata]|uniref:Hypothetical_protein n=1 Tax=Hexamita inflata TaxID=28002 RepID=A0AA86UXW2_9EUKA|nr:Hypothetical protein HINF_LOCUS56612 [Hexamita inflata]
MATGAFQNQLSAPSSILTSARFTKCHSSFKCGDRCVIYVPDSTRHAQLLSGVLAQDLNRGSYIEYLCFNVVLYLVLVWRQQGLMGCNLLLVTTKKILGPRHLIARYTTCGFLRRNTALKARAAAHSNLSRSGRRNLPKSLSLEDGQDSSFPFQRPRTRTGPLWFPGCQHGFASPSICPVRFEQPWLRAVVRLLFSNWVRL